MIPNKNIIKIKFAHLFKLDCKLTKEPVEPDALTPLFPMELIKQEVTAEKWVNIPDEVRHIYSMWRPTPLYRAYGLEKALGTPTKIYYKYEGIKRITTANDWQAVSKLVVTK